MIIESSKFLMLRAIGKFLPLWLLLFLNTANGADTAQVEVSLKKKTLTIISPTGQTEVEPISDISALTPGNYKISAKKRSGGWNAPDEYFVKRKLSPPDREATRTLRGALGDLALTLEPAAFIHSGPVASGDLKGARLTRASLSRIYFKLPVGTLIEVK